MKRRVRCPECRGEKGTRGGVWDERLCQHGARRLASEGKGFREILQYYYGEVGVIG